MLYHVGESFIKKGGLNVKKNVRLITETAVLTALLVSLQYLTSALGQLVTGSCVNMVLAVGALVVGTAGGAALAVLSPFLAYFVGVGPTLLPLIPAIALGNVVFVLLLSKLAGDGETPMWRRILGWLAAAIAKFAVLYLVVVRLLCSVLSLSEGQVKNFSAMFSWPQLVTALIGGAVGLVVAQILRKIRRNP